MKRTFDAVDPAGTKHQIATTREIGFAAFLQMPDGTYAVRFAKTAKAARATWGAYRTTVVRATAI